MVTSNIQRRGVSRPGVPRRTKLIGALVAAGLSIAGFSGTAPAHASESGAACATMTVIAVRGTNAPGGVGNGNGRVWASGSGGSGPILSSFTNLFIEEPFDVRRVSLIYPAAGGTDYGSSVATGINNLTAEVNWLMNNCATQPMVVLIGHSQGAQVILDALASGQFSSTSLDHIMAVGVFGDPAYQANQPIDAPGNGTGKGVFTRGYQTQLFLNGFKSYWGDQKIRSWCYTGDAFCQRGVGSDALAIHNSYLNTTARQNEAYAYLKNLWSW